MNTCSEDSFAWTNASSDSNISDMSGENGDQTLYSGDSDSGKEYKKKLHLQLDLYNDNTCENKIKSKIKKNKDSIKGDSPNRKHIKIEPESEEEKSSKKHNGNKDITNGYYSNMSLKDEEISAKSKKKRKIEVSPHFIESINHCKLDSEGQANETLTELRHQEEFNGTIDMDKSDHIATDHENFNLSKKLSKKQKAKMEQSNYNNEMEIGIEEISDYKYEKCDRIFKGVKDLDICEKEANLQNGIHKDQTPDNGRNISDRLIFEDSDADSSLNGEVQTMSSRLKKYLKSKPNLKLLSKNTEQDSFITNDDEIWLLKCPHYLNIETLKDTTVTVNDKIKIKAKHHSYHGHLIKDDSRIALLTWDSKKYLVHHSVLSGTVDLQKRIPMPSFTPDDSTDNNESVLLSPPEFKCAHPLFGRHYKNQMKIPRAVAEFSSAIKEEKEGRKKKKRKRERESSISIKEEQTEEQEPELESQTPVKRKKRKCKNSQCEDLDHSRKAKRIKREHSSSVVWESAKAIEDSLFNF